MAALAPGLFKQANVADRHAASDTLGHVVEREPRDTDRTHRFHFHPGLAAASRVRFDGDAVLFGAKEHLHVGERDGMA